MLLWLACSSPEPKANAPETQVDSVVDSVVDSIHESKGDSPQGTDTSESQPPVIPLNLVVIQVDTFRADHLSAYGSARETMPLTMQWPWQVVNGYHATSSWTMPSSASAMTGQHPYHHALTYMTELGIPSPTASVSMGNHLQNEGYRTAVFSGNWFYLVNSGLNFEYSLVVSKRPGYSNLGDLTTEAFRWLDSGQGPFFWLLQPMNQHAPYSPVYEDRGVFMSGIPPFPLDAAQQDIYIADALANAATPEDRAIIIQQIKDIYDEEILGLDRSIDALLHELQNRQLLDHTIIVLTADHGETIDDDGTGMVGHGKTLRPELLHVPLMFMAPGGMAVPTPDCFASGVDLAPTLLEMLSLPPMPDMDGHSLLQSCEDVAYMAYDNEAGIEFVSARTPEIEMIWGCQGGVSITYDLVTDPTGNTPAMGSYPQIEAGLQNYLDAVLQARPGLGCPR